MKRRNFIQISPYFALIPWAENAMPLFGIPPSVSKPEKVKVFIHLRGGLDGAYTLMPLAQSERYQALRPSLSTLQKRYEIGTLLKGKQRCGIHPTLRALLPLYDKGKMQIQINVGQKAHYATHWQAEQALYTSLATTLQPHSPTDGGAYPTVLQIGHATLNDVFETDQTSTWHIERKEIKDGTHFVPLCEPIPPQYQKQEAVLSALETAANKGYNQTRYPDTAFAQQLRQVTRLINGGCQTPFYHLVLDGFDTHKHQAETYSQLLKTFAEGIAAFQKDLHLSGLEKHVTSLAFSEFGRSPIENRHGGTEHGTTAPVFIFGDNIQNSIVGEHPDLDDLNKNKQTQGHSRLIEDLFQDALTETKIV